MVSGQACPVGPALLLSALGDVLTRRSAYIAKKLCPDLVVVKSHYERYNEMSNKVMTVCRRYDPNMSVVGCDEGYLK